MVTGFGPGIGKEDKDFGQRIFRQGLQKVADITVVQREVFKFRIMGAAHGFGHAVQKRFRADKVNAFVMPGLPKQMLCPTKADFKP